MGDTGHSQSGAGQFKLQQNTSKRCKCWRERVGGTRNPFLILNWMDPRYSKVRGQLLWVNAHGGVKISAPLTVDAKPGTKLLARRRFAINPLGMVRLSRRCMSITPGVAQGAKWVPFLCSGNILSGQSWAAERAMFSF
jgi:hypothetical protein